MLNRRGVLAVGAALCVLVAGGAVVAVTRSADDGDPVVRDRPNIVVIMSDDQTLESLRVMEKTNALVGRAGTTFTDAVVSFPNCCPSRATYLTGQYSHNHGVRDNVRPNGGFAKLRGDETLPVWLGEAGYATAHVGKYLNTWGDGGEIEAPPGWDHWYSLIDPSTYKYFGFDVSDNGERVKFGDDTDDYSTDVLAREAVRYIDERADDAEPFFLSFTPLAPHVASPEGSGKFKLPTPPPRYADRFADAEPPRTASYDEADVADKPAEVQREPIDPASEAYIRRYYQAELGAVLGLDDAVGQIFDALEETGQLENTVVIFTSDNGLFHGEHRLRTGKFYLYEPAVKVPLMIRGGPFPAGAVVGGVASNVDLAPTILGLADARAGLTMDGRDLAEIAVKPELGDGRAVLLENQRGNARKQVVTESVRTSRWSYIESKDGFVELYDLSADPDQVTSLANDPAHAGVRTEMARRLEILRSCAGDTCQQADGADPAPSP